MTYECFVHYEGALVTFCINFVFYLQYFGNTHNLHILSIEWILLLRWISIDDKFCCFKSINQLFTANWPVRKFFLVHSTNRLEVTVSRYRKVAVCHPNLQIPFPYCFSSLVVPFSFRRICLFWLSKNCQWCFKNRVKQGF